MGTKDMRHHLCMKLQVLLVGSLLFLTMARDVSAQDTEHLAAARKYAAAVPMDDEIDRMLSFYVQNTPPRDRVNAASLIRSRLDRDRLAQIYLSILVEVYTVEELDALAKFYSSPVGASAREKQHSVRDKYWLYREEVERAVREAQREVESGSSR